MSLEELIKALEALEEYLYTPNDRDFDYDAHTHVDEVLRRVKTEGVKP